MKRLIIILAIISFACKTEIITNSYNANPSNTTSNVHSTTPVVKSNTILYFIRHAETVGNGEIVNPDLSEKGKKRAMSYVTYFEDKKVDSIFTTNFKRTVQTITPLAKNKGINPIFYDPNDIDYKNFIKQNKGKTIVVVGHSNTTPNFVNKLIGIMKYSQMVDENYSDIFKVVPVGKNKAVEQVFVLEDELAKIAKIKAELEKKKKKKRKKINRN